MNLISLIKKLFGTKKQESTSYTPAHMDYMARHEKERQERMVAAEKRIKGWVTASLKDKGSLLFSWESGNDEAFVTFQDTTESNRDDFQDLEEYIIDKLDIPDAGEFQMNGRGKIYIENNLVRAEYSSVMKGMIDYNEETDEAVFSEEELDSGDKVLFSIR